jgi:hypothetical protein
MTNAPDHKDKAETILYINKHVSAEMPVFKEPILRRRTSSISTLSKTP